MLLKVGPRLDGGHRSDVFRCTTSDGADAVLKLTPTRHECATEAAALAAWRGSGAAVSLRSADLALKALLVDLLVPGTPLPPGREAYAVGVAAELLARLHDHSSSFPFAALHERYAEFEQHSRQDAAYEQEVLGNCQPPGLSLLPGARAMMRHLSATASMDVLLHGDFVDKNLLLDRDGYLVIDPIPMVGDPCSDVGFFAAYHPPASTAFDCAAAIASDLGYDKARAARWTAVWIAHQACETWRADSEELHAIASGRQIGRLLET